MSKAPTTVAKVETTPEVVTNVIAPLNEAQLEAEVKRAGSVSALFRELTAKGMSRGQIAKYTGKRYQHVRNVLITPVKKQAAV